MNTQSKPRTISIPRHGSCTATSGATYMLDLRQPRVDLLQIEDVCFGLDREILLPVDPQTFQPDPEPSQAQGPLAGLDAVRAALEFASYHPEKQLLVVGHTDTSGSDAHNLALSQRRAQSVALYLRGDRAAWAAQAADNDEVADLQTILKWASVAHGWPTDPGDVDGVWGDHTKAARRALRQIANATFGLSLALDGSTQTDDWAAIFDTYDLALARSLKTDREGLAKLRASLRFVDDGLLGCGEHWPVSGLGLDDQQVAADRRVELLWFDADEVVETGGDLPGEHIYSDDQFRFEPIPVRPGDPGQTLHFEVRCTLLDHFHVQPIAQRGYRLRGPLPSTQYDRRGVTDADGRLHQDELPAGDYFLQIDQIGIVVGARYLFSSEDREDVYRLALDAARRLPNSPQPYADPWMLIEDDNDSDAFANVGVDPYEPDEPEADVGMILVEDDDLDLPCGDSNHQSAAA